MNYVGFLRGINVGGNHKVSMEELKKLFLSWNCLNIKTIGNTGNILYETKEPINDKWISDQLAMVFGFSLPYVSFECDKLSSIMEKAPAWWGEREDWRHNAIFLLNEYQASDALIEIGDYNEKIEKICVIDNIILWSFEFNERKDYYQSKYSKVLKMKSYQFFTIRNFNTCKKLIQSIKE